MSSSPPKLPGVWPTTPTTPEAAQNQLSVQDQPPLPPTRPKSPRIKVVNRNPTLNAESAVAKSETFPPSSEPPRVPTPQPIKIKLINKQNSQELIQEALEKLEIKQEKPEVKQEKPVKPKPSVPTTPEPKSRTLRSTAGTPVHVSLDKRVLGNETGVVYDEAMALHANLDTTHPESPNRILGISSLLNKKGLTKRMKEIKAREAARSELELIHTSDYLNFIDSLPSKTPEELMHLGHTYDSIYFNVHSRRAALLSCGSVVEMCEQVWLGELRNGACIVRPPGHHAEATHCKGFCLYTNTAVAAKVLQKRYKVDRILIVDWDVHHGNGIQNAFYEDPNVLYISIHRHDGSVEGAGSFYPHGEAQNGLACGQGKGLGKNVNIPWPRSGFGDADYLHVFNEIILPIAYEFNPSFVMVSAGFDAAEGDPLGEMKVTPTGYAHMLSLLSNLAEGKIVVALEGGYNVSAISNSFEACVRTLLRDPLPRFMKPLIPSHDAIHTVNHVLKIQSRYWKSLTEKSITVKDSDDDFEQAFSHIKI